MAKKSYSKSWGNIKGGHIDNLNINGICNVEDDVFCDTILVSGTANFEGNVQSDTIKINGAVNIEGDVKADSIIVNGVMNAQNIESENITIYGVVKIDGDINAENLESYGICMFNNLYGEKIVIKGGRFKGHLQINFNGQDVKQTQLSVFNEIEATSIELSHITGKRISGEHIILGENVEIDVVEYSKSISLNPKSKINSIIKL